ncbi:MAG: zf-HC2 domain-containing protein, partial [Pseudomonadales bacterium]|nr:zf-HC2 domain-containing protein [Pseudomonadales bacterium]
MKSHEEVKELLPWFVNGSLNEDEQSIVNEHLESCDECQRDIEQLLMISKEFNATVDIDDDWDDYIEVSSRNFMGKLDESPRKQDLPVQSRSRQPWLWISSAVDCSFIVDDLYLLTVGDAYR